jgi:hypothetical protein
MLKPEEGHRNSDLPYAISPQPLPKPLGRLVDDLLSRSLAEAYRTYTVLAEVGSWGPTHFCLLEICEGDGGVAVVSGR